MVVLVQQGMRHLVTSSDLRIHGGEPNTLGLFFVKYNQQFKTPAKFGRSKTNKCKLNLLLPSNRFEAASQNIICSPRSGWKKEEEAEKKESRGEVRRGDEQMGRKSHGGESKWKELEATARKLTTRSLQRLVTRRVLTRMHVQNLGCRWDDEEARKQFLEGIVS